MGVTVMFSCSGVDKARFLDHVAESAPTYGDWGKCWAVRTDGKEDGLFSPYLQEPFDRARADGLIPADIRSIGGTWGRVTDAGEATALNVVVMAGYDCTDVRDLTAAEIEGRRQALLAIEALRRYTPGFERATLRTFGATLGTRDSRKIVGRYELTGDDVRGEARFPDSVGIFPEFLDGYGVLVLPTTGRYFQVPYGILVPRDVDNLLVAGRCVAGDKISHAATRNQLCCAVTGQAAGTAAAVSLRDGSTTAAVDVGACARGAAPAGRAPGLTRGRARTRVRAAIRPARPPRAPSPRTRSGRRDRRRARAPGRRRRCRTRSARAPAQGCPP